MDYNSYGGGGQYSTTSYGAQGGAGGGGFMGGSQSGSQNNTASKGNHGKDTLRPVTIKQILDAQQPHPDAEFSIDNAEITQVTFVGQIRNISTQTTNLTYKLDDGTGTMEVKLWVDSDAVAAGNMMDEGEDSKVKNAEKEKLVENEWARVWGRLKAFNDRRHVGVHVIRPIIDKNEIQYHMLEATAVHLYFTRGPPEQFKAGANGAANGAGAPNHAGGGGDTSGYGDAAANGDGANGRPLPPMTQLAKRVYSTLKSTPQNNEGLHVQNIAANSGLNIADVMKGGDELLGHGVIFTTVDENTWALLDY
ncbi:replication factor A protein 2 [Bachmanniomyces sp. S44760]|nr:replication factor A protein 2 [Bachmanniomyces sp. S44760]